MRGRYVLPRCDSVTRCIVCGHAPCYNQGAARKLLAGNAPHGVSSARPILAHSENPLAIPDVTRRGASWHLAYG